MHGNMNQEKRPARKQPIKKREQPWKIARDAQRRSKRYRQHVAFSARDDGKSGLVSA